MNKVFFLKLEGRQLEEYEILTCGGDSVCFNFVHVYLY